jgi:hypothetical protein
MARKNVKDVIESASQLSPVSQKGDSEKRDRAGFGWNFLDIISGHESKKMLDFMINHTGEGRKYQTHVELKKMKAQKGLLFFS